MSIRACPHRFIPTETISCAIMDRPLNTSVDVRQGESSKRTADFAISNSNEVDMGDKGKRDKARRDGQKKKPKLTLKEKRKRKKEKKG